MTVEMVSIGTETLTANTAWGCSSRTSISYAMVSSSRLGPSSPPTQLQAHPSLPNKGIGRQVGRRQRGPRYPSAESTLPMLETSARAAVRYSG